MSHTCTELDGFIADLEILKRRKEFYDAKVNRLQGIVKQYLVGEVDQAELRDYLDSHLPD